MTVKFSLAENNRFEVDLFDLDDRRFYVKIEDVLVNKIKSKIEQRFGSINYFSKKINEIPQTFYGWTYKREFPLSILKILKVKLNIPKEEIRKRVVQIRSGLYPSGGGGNSKPISPKFPIKLTEELVRIIAHIFGDGNLSVDAKNLINITYYNQSDYLMKQFIKDVKEVFNIEKTNIGINKTTPYLRLPTPIGLILLHRIENFNSKKCRIPGFIKTSPKKFRIEFLKSFFDDEAHVRYDPPRRYIEVALSNKDFIKDLSEMLGEFEIFCSRVYHKKIRDFDIFYFYIRSHNLEKYYQKIGFNNPRKQKKLELIIKNPGRKSYLHGETKEKIVRLLKERQLLSSQIAKKLDRKLCTINHFLKILEKEKQIKCVGKKKKYKLYEVTNVI